MIKESPEKKKSYIFASVTFAISIILVILAIRPTILTITRINSEISRKKIVDTQLDNKIQALSSLDAQYLGIEDNIEDLQLIYPADGNFSLFLSNIEAIVSRNGFDLKGINFDDYSGESFDTNSKVLIPWSVRLTVKGRKINFVNLLKDFESLPMYPVVESVSYNSQSDEEGLTSFSITLRIYHIENNNFYE